MNELTRRSRVRYRTEESELFEQSFIATEVFADPYRRFGPVDAREYEKLRREGCPRPSGFAQTIVSGGLTTVDVSRVKGGTQFDPISGTEIPIAKSANTLTGGGGHFFAAIPTNQNILWGDYFYVNASGSVFDGNGSGTVPIGGNNVAFTYLVPNPISGSTGIFPARPANR